ncbi:MAG: response regulator [Geobacteraceae bacterium]|nr:response regulator [Geobacteraceae bacterium]
MGWFANLKIGTKILLGFVAIILISLVTVLAGILGMGRIDGLLVKINKTIMHQIVYSNDINANLTLHNRRALRHILSPGNEEMEQIRSQMRMNELAISDLLEKYRTTNMDSTEQRLLERFARAWPDYVTVIGQVARLSLEGKKDVALRLVENEGRDRFHELEGALDDLIKYNVSEGRQLDEEAEQLYQALRNSLVTLMLFSLLIALVISWGITRSVVGPVRQVLDTLGLLSQGVEDKASLAEAIAGGDLERQVRITEPLGLDPAGFTRDEAGVLLKTVSEMSSLQAKQDKALARMTEALRRVRDDEADRDWLKNGVGEMNALMRGERQLQNLVELSLSTICNYLEAAAGAFYLWDDRNGVLAIAAGHALKTQDAQSRSFRPGQGIAGQAASEQRTIILTDVPPGYLTVSSGLGEAEPLTIAAMPLIHDKRLIGVIEIASFRTFASREQDLLEQVRQVLSAGVGVCISRRLVDELLEQTQSQTEELRVQQEELQQSNEELEERAQMLEQQREQIRAKNREVEEASQELQRKADELERTSAFKSEFLANMSHELRTPLNSLLILSRLLMDNREGNLNEKQIEFARTMNDAGNDLLNLINDILDLSKVEAGRLEFHYETMPLDELFAPLGAMFRPLAEQKGLGFECIRAEHVPENICIDGQRTQQILKNLLSNAFKFTAHGSVTLMACMPAEADNPLPLPAIAFSVSDSGIGISTEKQEVIFQAFQQGDGSTSRKFGGTGLGLSISRQMARAMHGDIVLASHEGQGSVFTLYLPLQQVDSVGGETPAIAARISSGQPPSPTLPTGSKNVAVPALADDHDLLQEGHKSILIIEDDLNFARILMDMVRERGFYALSAANGEDGLYLADRFLPAAIILDVMLPHVDGWGVMRLLKENPRTRHIPVHFLTCLEDRQKAMSMGAIGFVTKPADPDQLEEVFSTIEKAISCSVRKLLIVEDNHAEAKSLLALLESRGVEISLAGSGDEAIALLSREHFDCMVLDLGLSDMSGFDLLEHIRKQDENCRLPVIIHTGRSLTHEEELKLRHYTESIIIKGAKSPERLLNEATLFLHQVEGSLKPDKQRMLRASLDKETMLEGKKVLLVDDDMRNVFSITSVLSGKNMLVVEAENGREALERLEEHPDVDLVLMDIMMPEMDGYETIRAIRKDSRFSSLHIIAMTAKALKGDQEKCLEAGASDYIAKPIDVDKLLSLMRVWLYQQG